MNRCPDCYSQVGSLPRHRPICLVRNNKGLRDALLSAEYWLARIEASLNAAYRAIACYTQVWPHPREYEWAQEELGSATAQMKRVPPLLERMSGQHCERVASAQLSASALGMQVAEVRDILAKLSPPKRRGMS